MSYLDVQETTSHDWASGVVITGTGAYGDCDRPDPAGSAERRHVQLGEVDVRRAFCRLLWASQEAH